LATAALALAAPAGQAAPSASPSSNGVTVAESDLTAAAAPSGYGPASLQAAYNLPSSSGGSGQTVAIVDAYDDPNAEADLAVYRSQYGLSACTTANGCFKKVNQTGGTSYPRGDSGWAEEMSLDLDMVSAACPNCKILLVEASSATMTNLGTAVNTAVGLGAKYVSNSYGGSESSSDSTYDSSYFNHPGVAITVSSGDNGYGAEYPAASKYVTAVGGTSLKTSSTTRGWTDTVWSGAGSGCSSYDAKPTWQTDSGCAKRTVADVSAVADPNTGVAVYDSYRQATGWMVFGGTSASAPLIAATYALAGAPSSGSYPASFPYAHTSALYDVTSGSNGSCSGSYLCTGTTGYDGPTGLGVPNGTAAFTG
jgi:subtilase family serine protease